MQRISNYGSFLQAYGLKEILKELGAEVEFVDYHPGKCLISPDSNRIARKLKKGIEIFSGSGSAVHKIQFIKYKRDFGKKYFPFLGIDGNYNYSPKLDLLVIGSDEVFNCVQQSINVGYAPKLFGKKSCQKSYKLCGFFRKYNNRKIRAICN